MCSASAADGLQCLYELGAQKPLWRATSGQACTFSSLITRTRNGGGPSECSCKSTSAEGPSAEDLTEDSDEDAVANCAAVEHTVSEGSSLEVNDTASGSTYLERSSAVDGTAPGSTSLEQSSAIDCRASWSTSLEGLLAEAPAANS